MADRMTLSFEVDEVTGAYIAELIQDGRYGSLGDYLRDLIRLDQETSMDGMSSERLQRLRVAFEAPESDYVDMDAETFLAELKQRHRSCAA